MQMNFRVRHEPNELAPEIVAADEANIRQTRDGLGQVNLKWLQPEGARPGRAGGIDLMKDSRHSSGMFPPQRAQDRQQSKRNAALLISVIHIMQQHAIEFRLCVFEQAFKRKDLESARSCRRIGSECREDRVASEVVPQLSGNRERVISDPVDPSGNSRNDLQKGAQDETASPRRG